MTRKYIEAVTGVYTGSDMNLSVTLPLLCLGLAGEEHVCDDKTVWITKTHWPEPSQ